MTLLEEVEVRDQIHLIEELAEIKRVHQWLAQWRWSEASGGNFSIRLDALPEDVQDLSGETPQPLPLKTPSLGGSYLFISAKGSRARDLAVDPVTGVGLFWILQNGAEFTCLWGVNNPTSELHVHLSIHNAFVQARSAHRAVLHTHPANLVALTHGTNFDDHIDLSDIILRMQSSARAHLPEGIGRVPFTIPGSIELGQTSARALLKTPLILWDLDGAMATGVSLSEALDHLEIADKAAQIYWMLRSSGIKPQGLSDADLERSLRHYKVWERYRSSLD